MRFDPLLHQNQLIFWYDDKTQLSRVDTVDWKKKKKKVIQTCKVIYTFAQVRSIEIFHIYLVVHLEKVVLRIRFFFSKIEFYSNQSF